MGSESGPRTTAPVPPLAAVGIEAGRPSERQQTLFVQKLLGDGVSRLPVLGRPEGRQGVGQPHGGKGKARVSRDSRGAAYLVLSLRS